ncbi:MAG TPA: transposase [Armatimonadota bacterium]|nr:transposase [Armatimonadota bacterium]
MHKDRSLLTAAQWARLSPLLPGQQESPGTTARDTRLFVEAVRWRARCGVSWPALPAERCGPWQTVYARFRRWRQARVWPQVLAQGQNATGRHRLLVDSTAVRAHQAVAGATKKTAPLARPSAAAAAVSPPNATCVARRRAACAPWP